MREQNATLSRYLGLLRVFNIRIMYNLNFHQQQKLQDRVIFILLLNYFLLMC